MQKLSHFLDKCLSEGRACFTQDEAIKALNTKVTAFRAAAGRLIRQQRLVNVGRGFYLIIRPEDRLTGAPDPIGWIDPFMNHLGLDYRVSLLRAAAHHGAAHQAAMVFQVIVPKQLGDLSVGQHRLSFIYQHPGQFAHVNQTGGIVLIKSDAGFAKASGIELLLLDCMRYYHQAGGLNAVAQIVKDLGSQAKITKLAILAHHYENACVRRLGYLLGRFGHLRQAKALLPAVKRAKSFVLLDPSVKSLPPFDDNDYPDERWKLTINEIVEIDF